MSFNGFTCGLAIDLLSQLAVLQLLDLKGAAGGLVEDLGGADGLRGRGAGRDVEGGPGDSHECGGHERHEDACSG